MGQVSRQRPGPRTPADVLRERGKLGPYEQQPAEPQPATRRTSTPRRRPKRR